MHGNEEEEEEEEIKIRLRATKIIGIAFVLTSAFTTDQLKMWIFRLANGVCVCAAGTVTSLYSQTVDYIWNIYEKKRKQLTLIWASLNMKMRISSKCEFLRINSEVGRSILDFMPIYFDFTVTQSIQNVTRYTFAHMQKSSLIIKSNKCWKTIQIPTICHYKQNPHFRSDHPTHRTDEITMSRLLHLAEQIRQAYSQRGKMEV